MEIKRYNKLIKLLRKSLNNLMEAIEGVTVMDNENEKILNSIMENRLP